MTRWLLAHGTALLCVHGLAASAMQVFTNSIGMPFVPIPAGEFTMGSTEAESARTLQRMKEKRVSDWYQQSPLGEAPEHRVRITKPFYFGMFEVRLGDFRKFAAATKFRTDA